MEKKEITFYDDNYNKIICELLATFYSDETKQTYAIYTDNELDKDGEKKIWASRCIKINDKIKFADIEEDKEWDIIDKYIEDNLK